MFVAAGAFVALYSTEIMAVASVAILSAVGVGVGAYKITTCLNLGSLKNSFRRTDCQCQFVNNHFPILGLSQIDIPLKEKKGFCHRAIEVKMECPNCRFETVRNFELFKKGKRMSSNKYTKIKKVVNEIQSPKNKVFFDQVLEEFNQMNGKYSLLGNNCQKWSDKLWKTLKIMALHD